MRYENVIHEDDIPLLEMEFDHSNEADDFHLEMNAEGESDAELLEYKPVLFDGTRRFYDDDARRQAKIKAYKKCILFTTCCTALWGAGVGTAAYLLNLLTSLIVNAFSDYNTSIHDVTILASLEIACMLPTIFVFFAHHNWAHQFTPYVAEYNPFTTYRQTHRYLCDNIEIVVHPEFHIPEELIKAAAKRSTRFTHKKESIKNIKTACENSRWWKLQRFLPGRFRKNYDNINKISERLNQDPPIREEYRNVAYKIKQILLEALPSEMVKKIFCYFPQNNILLHMLAHEPESKWRTNYSYIHENEFLSLWLIQPSLLDLSAHHAVQNYYNASMLEQNGWISFLPSKKYSLRCAMYYFDHGHVPNHKNKYSNRFGVAAPIIYLPYSLELANFYSFDLDPEYYEDHKKPRNKKIKHLMAKRKEIVNRLFLLEQNNNN